MTPHTASTKYSHIPHLLQQQDKAMQRKGVTSYFMHSIGRLMCDKHKLQNTGRPGSIMEPCATADPSVIGVLVLDSTSLLTLGKSYTTQGTFAGSMCILKIASRFVRSTIAAGLSQMRG